MRKGVRIMTYTIAVDEQYTWIDPINVKVTSTMGMDEYIRYRQIEKELVRLEESTTCDEEGLTCLQMQAYMLVDMDDEREELLIRIRWLKKLYDVAKKVETVETVETKKDIERLKAILIPLPPMPLKKVIEQQLQQKSVREENDQQWITHIMEKADPIFLNLGKEGRRAVIRELENRKYLPIDSLCAYVREQAVKMEENVRQLAFIESVDSLVEALNALPFSLYRALSHEEKRKVAQYLYDMKPFNRGVQAVAQAIDKFVEQMKNDEEMWGAVAEVGLLSREMEQMQHVQYVAKRATDDVMIFEKTGP